MTYLSDWKEAEEQAAHVRAMNPDCTGTADCHALPSEGTPENPTGGHHLSCVKYLQERRERR